MQTSSIHISPDPAAHYLLRLGDTCLILGQRLAEWCGHGPILEEDIALTNMALDLVGQARALLRGRAAGRQRKTPHGGQSSRRWPSRRPEGVLPSAAEGGAPKPAGRLTCTFGRTSWISGAGISRRKREGMPYMSMPWMRRASA